MSLWDRMEKEFEHSQAESVRTRLNRWRDYDEHSSNSTPGKAYTPEDMVADAIYRMRRPSPSMNTPDPRLNLEVSDSTIRQLLEKVRKDEKYLF